MRDFKTDFDAWLLDWSTEAGCENPITMRSLYSDFGGLPKSMQWGVRVDFFDSVGIYIDIYYEESDTFYFRINEKLNIKWYESRKEARKKALEQAEKIYEQLEPKPIIT